MANNLSAPARILTLPTGLTAPVPAQRMPAGRPRHNVVRLRHAKPTKSTAAPQFAANTLLQTAATLEEAIAQEMRLEIERDEEAIACFLQMAKKLEFKVAAAKAQLMHQADAQQRRITTAH